MSDLITEAEDLAMAGKIPEAIEKYEEAIKEDPKNPLSFVGKASLEKAIGKYDEAVLDLGKALDILPEWQVAKEDEKRYKDFVSMLHVLRAEVRLYADKPDEALDDLDAADLAREPDAASMVVRANALAQKKEWMEAGDLLYRAEEWCFLHEDSMLTQVWLTKIHCAKECGGVFAPPYAALVYESGNWRIPKGTAEELVERAENLRKEGLLFDALRYFDAALEAEPKDRNRIVSLRDLVISQIAMTGVVSKH